WVRIQLRMTSNCSGRVELFADFGDGFHVSECLQRIDCRGSATLDQVIRLPRPVRGIRFDPLDTAGDFRVIRLRMQPVSFVEAVRLAGDRKWRQWKGILGTSDAAYQMTEQDLVYQAWRQRHAVTEVDRAPLRAEATALTNAPLISVLVPADDDRGLERSLKSVLGQTYPHWQICIASPTGRLGP